MLLLHDMLNVKIILFLIKLLFLYLRAAYFTYNAVEFSCSQMIYDVTEFNLTTESG